MIILDVKKYCHNCPLFDVSSDIVLSTDNRNDVYVRCSKYVACDVVEKYLERSKMEEMKHDTHGKIGY